MRTRVADHSGCMLIQTPNENKYLLVTDFNNTPCAVNATFFFNQTQNSCCIGKIGNYHKL